MMPTSAYSVKDDDDDIVHFRNVITYRLDGDKGFNFSQSDKAFVCQKKNHFQITGCLSFNDVPQYVMTTEGPKPIDELYMHFYGVKVSERTSLPELICCHSDVVLN